MLHCTSLPVRQPSTYRPWKPPGPAIGKVETEMAREYMLPLFSLGVWDSEHNLRLLGILPGKSPPSGKELVPLKGTGSPCRPVLGMTFIWGLAYLFFSFGMKDQPRQSPSSSHICPGEGEGRRKRTKRPSPLLLLANYSQLKHHPCWREVWETIHHTSK